jgi:hypothetical protein
MGLIKTGPIQVTFANRGCFTVALVLGDEVVLGAVPMEDMDLVLSPAREAVEVNPNSPNIPMSVAKQGSHPGIDGSVPRADISSSIPPALMTAGRRPRGQSAFLTRPGADIMSVTPFRFRLARILLGTSLIAVSIEWSSHAPAQPPFLQSARRKINPLAQQMSDLGRGWRASLRTIVRERREVFDSPGRKAGDLTAKVAIRRQIPGLPAWAIRCFCRRRTTPRNNSDYT